MRLAFWPLGFAVLCGSCIVEAPGQPGKNAAPVNPDKARAITGQVQPLQIKLGANMEDKLEILGATIQPGALVPGEQGKVTAYYKVLAPIEQDFMVFVHVEDPDGHMERLNVDHPPGGGARPTSQWAVGETIKDEYVVYVPTGSQVRGLMVWTGFWQPRTDARLKLKNVDQVKNDGNNRVMLAQIPVVQ
jgi:hypothetical protein